MYKPTYRYSIHSPINGIGKEGLTVAGRELAFRFVDDYKHSLATASRNYAT